jgi:hypothetical protein
MSTFGSRIWYGTFHDGAGLERPHLVPSLLWIAALLLLLSVRLLLPFAAVDTLVIHSRIADSLAAGQIWGRQAFVGSPEFPPLPTLALFFARRLGQWVGLPAGHALTVVCQIWVVFYLLRLPVRLVLRLLAVAPLMLLSFSPECRTVVLGVDPNWVAAVPAACGLFHLLRWQQHDSLRDAVLVAVNCGFLALVGPAGICLGLVFLLTAVLNLRRVAESNDSAVPQGVRLLLWTPFLYGLLLLFVANWLIMRNFVFFLQRILEAVTSLSPETFLPLAAAQCRSASRVALGGILVSALYLRGRLRVAAVGLIAGLLVLLGAQVLFGALHIFLPGADILVLVLGAAGLAFPCFDTPGSGTPWWRPVLAALMIVATVGVTATRPRPEPAGQLSALQTAPHPGMITSWVDRFWDRARVMVYGIHAPAFYLDLEERRFVARVDFHENTLLDRARDEQVYVLIPPCDGTFYAARTSELADIHRHGRPWLLLEKTWPGGWQLGRCVIVPDNERVVKPFLE